MPRLSPHPTFCDEVKVTFLAGKGGGGCTGFRREKFIPYGGPDGGDGGKGGDIVLLVDPNINTLSEFNQVKVFRADDGKPGMGKKMHGKNGEGMILRVPPGTLVYDEKKKNLLADLVEKDETFVIAGGGRGGFGNSHFKSSTRQAPKFAELGEPGEESVGVLELKLVGDVGIMGFPSVGKSSFISRVSSARPKIADYPFTTLVPNLGVVYLSMFGGSVKESFVVCDLPGLIEGAHEGKGLGIQFLKHVSRNRILIHMLDGNEEDMVAKYKILRKELRSYDRTLLSRPEIVAMNKIDLFTPEEREKKKKVFLRAVPKLKGNFYEVSCATGEGLKELVFAAWNILLKLPKEKIVREETEEYKVFQPHLDDAKSFTVTRMVKGPPQKFKVEGKRIEQIVIMTNVKNPQALNRVYDVFQKLHIQNELKRQGAKEGDEILIGKQILIFHDV